MLLEIAIYGHMLLTPGPVLTEDHKRVILVPAVATEFQDPLHVESTSAPTVMHVQELAPPWAQLPQL